MTQTEGSGSGGLRRAIAGALVAVAIAALGAGCVIDGGEPGPLGIGEEPPAPGVAEFVFEELIVSIDTLGVESSLETSYGGPAAPQDPCACTTDQCLRDWAEGSFGCQVCVSLLCDGEPGPHVCTGTCE